jgi:hypothetical protein
MQDADVPVLPSTSAAAAAAAAPPPPPPGMPHVLTWASVCALVLTGATLTAYVALPAAWTPLVVGVCVVLTVALALAEYDAFAPKPHLSAAAAPALALWTLWLTLGALALPYTLPEYVEHTWMLAHSLVSAALPPLLLLFGAHRALQQHQPTARALLALFLFQNAAVLFMHPLSVPTVRTELRVIVKTGAFLMLYLLTRQLQMICAQWRWYCTLVPRRVRGDRYALLFALVTCAWTLYTSYALLAVFVPLTLAALMAHVMLAAMRNSGPSAAASPTPPLHRVTVDRRRGASTPSTPPAAAAAKTPPAAPAQRPKVRYAHVPPSAVRRTGGNGAGAGSERSELATLMQINSTAEAGGDGGSS